MGYPGQEGQLKAALHLPHHEGLVQAVCACHRLPVLAEFVFRLMNAAAIEGREIDSNTVSYLPREAWATWGRRDNWKRPCICPTISGLSRRSVPASMSTFGPGPSRRPRKGPCTSLPRRAVSSPRASSRPTPHLPQPPCLVLRFPESRHSQHHPCCWVGDDRVAHAAVQSLGWKVQHVMQLQQRGDCSASQQPDLPMSVSGCCCCCCCCELAWLLLEEEGTDACC